MLLQGNGNFSLDIRHDYDMQVEGKLLLQVLLGVTLLCTQQKTYFTRHFIHDKYPKYVHTSCTDVSILDRPTALCCPSV